MSNSGVPADGLPPKRPSPFGGGAGDLFAQIKANKERSEARAAENEAKAREARLIAEERDAKAEARRLKLAVEKESMELEGAQKITKEFDERQKRREALLKVGQGAKEGEKENNSTEANTLTALEGEDDTKRVMRLKKLADEALKEVARITENLTPAQQEEKKKLEEQEAQKKLELYFDEITKKYKFMILDGFNNKLPNVIGLAMSEDQNIGIQIGDSTYKQAVDQFTEEDREKLMKYLNSPNAPLTPEDQKSILEIAFRNFKDNKTNALTPEVLSKLAEPKRVNEVAQAIIHKKVEISDMSPAKVTKLWEDAYKKAESKISTTESKHYVPLTNGSEMGPFLDGPAKEIIGSLEGLNEVKEKINNIIIKLNEGTLSLENAAIIINIEQMKLAEIKKLYNKDVLTALAKNAYFWLPGERKKSYEGLKESNDILKAFSNDLDAAVNKAFKEIITVNNVVEGLDKLLEICQNATPEQKQNLYGIAKLAVQNYGVESVTIATPKEPNTKAAEVLARLAALRNAPQNKESAEQKATPKATLNAPAKGLKQSEYAKLLSEKAAPIVTKEDVQKEAAEKKAAKLAARNATNTAALNIPTQVLKQADSVMLASEAQAITTSTPEDLHKEAAEKKAAKLAARKLQSH